MTDLWLHLKKTEKPIVLYGMGNGADKVLDRLALLGIEAKGVFASDGFVRKKKLFRGFEVKTYGELKEQFPEMVVLVCFGSALPEVLERIRFIASEQELYVPDVAVIGGGIFDKDYASAHRGELEEVYARLADEKSKQVFENLVKYKITGKPSYLFECETTPDEAYEKVLKLTDNEVYADLGAYNGDTVAEFLRHVGAYERIYAVEPDKKSFEKLKANTKDLQNVFCINKGISDSPARLEFAMRAGRNSALSEKTDAEKAKPHLNAQTQAQTQTQNLNLGNLSANGLGNGSGNGAQAERGTKTVITEFDSLDGILGGNRVSFINFDVEGQEEKALEGARESIALHKPKMLVSCYHRFDDLLTLPRKVFSIREDYSLFIRHYPYLPAWDTAYYFI